MGPPAQPGYLAMDGLAGTFSRSAIGGNRGFPAKTLALRLVLPVSAMADRPAARMRAAGRSAIADTGKTRRSASVFAGKPRFPPIADREKVPASPSIAKYPGCAGGPIHRARNKCQSA